MSLSRSSSDRSLCSGVMTTEVVFRDGLQAQAKHLDEGAREMLVQPQAISMTFF